MTIRALTQSRISSRLLGRGTGGYPWDADPQGGRIYLLNPANGTYTRSGEASYLTSDNTMAWLSANVGPPRESALGASGYMIHRARTNSCLHSEALDNAAWTATGVTVNADADQPPDYADQLATDADELQFSASATADVAQTIAGTANSQTANLSCWVRCSSGTQTVRLAWTDRAGSTTNGVDIPVTTQWARIERATVGTGVGASSPVFRVRNGSDGAARNVFVWGAQVIIDAAATGGDYPKEYIRTTTAATTSGHAAWNFPSASVPTRIYSGVWAMDFIPDFSSSDIGASNTHYPFRFDVSSDRLAILGNGRMQLIIGGVGVADTNPNNPTYSRYQKMSVKIDFNTRQLTIAGATTNNGSIPISGVATFAVQNMNLGFGTSSLSGRVSLPYAA